MKHYTIKEFNAREDIHSKVTPDIKGKKLNLGCGYDLLKGFVNLDKSKDVNPDIVADIEQGLPFLPDTFDHIYSSHVLEHISPCKFRFVLDEIYRVAKNGCVLELWLPFDNISSRSNYDHHRTFTWNSFFPLQVGHDRSYYGQMRLKKLADNKPNILYKFFVYLFPQLCKRVYLKFEIVKEEKK